MAKNVYGNSIDLANAKTTLGNNYNYIDTSAQGYKGGGYTSNDIVVGGTGAIGGVLNSGSAVRLAGNNRDDTLNVIKGYASNQQAQQLQQATQQPTQQIQQPQQTYQPSPEQQQANALSQASQARLFADYQSQQASQQASQSAARNMSMVKPVVDNSAQLDLINKQSEASKLAAASALQKNRDLAVSGYNTKIGGLEQTYQPLRNSQDFQAAKTLQATKESYANMGIANSGDMVTSQIQNRVGNENALNTLSTQQNNDKTNYLNLIDNANNGYNSDLATSNATIDATKLQNLLAQTNADRTFNYGVSRDLVGDTGYNNGVQTMAGQSAQANIASSTADTFYKNLVSAGYPAEQAAKMAQSNATIANTQANTAGQLISNQYAPQLAQSTLNSQSASIANTVANTQYQQLVNAGYPAEQSAKMAQAVAALTGQNLNNDYQKLVNVGYTQEQAAKLAQQAAATIGQNLNNSAQEITNKYLPAQLQGSIDAQKASAAASYASAAKSASSGSTTANSSDLKDRAQRESELKAITDNINKLYLEPLTNQNQFLSDGTTANPNYGKNTGQNYVSNKEAIYGTLYNYFSGLPGAASGEYDASFNQYLAMYGIKAEDFQHKTQDTPSELKAARGW